MEKQPKLPRPTCGGLWTPIPHSLHLAPEENKQFLSKMVLGPNAFELYMKARTIGAQVAEQTRNLL